MINKKTLSRWYGMNTIAVLDTGERIAGEITVDGNDDLGILTNGLDGNPPSFYPRNRIKKMVAHENLYRGWHK